MAGCRRNRSTTLRSIRLRSPSISSTYPHRMLTEFQNEPFTDFSKPENKAAMEAALKKVQGEIGREYPLVIGGEHITGLDTFTSINPSHKSQLLGKFQKGKREHVEKAIEAAWKAFESWRKQPVEVRAGLLVKTAALLR